jgi:mono/diheme cytochrome c family protein
MSTCDDVDSRVPRIILGLVKKNTSFLLSLTAAILLAGCYAFVNDEDPPQWKDPAGAEQGVAAIAAGSGGPGAAVYNAKCAVCHQMSGGGIPNVYPTLVGSDLAIGDPALSIRIVLHGFNGPIERNGTRFNGVMQPWKNDLSDQEIADVLTYVRTSWGNAADAVTAEQVKEQRDLTKGKIGAYTEAELKSSL